VSSERDRACSMDDGPPPCVLLPSPLETGELLAAGDGDGVAPLEVEIGGGQPRLSGFRPPGATRGGTRIAAEEK
jgi:hypothetical protein